MAMSVEENIKRKVIVAMDGSKISENALKWYTETLRRDGDYVFIVYTPEFRNVSHISVMASDTSLVQKMVEEVRQNTDNLLERFKNLMNSLGVQGETRDSVGDPGEQIVEVANQVEANLIITGSRGLGTLRRTFLGSVSDYVVHHAHIPVLVYKPEHKE